MGGAREDDVSGGGQGTYKLGGVLDPIFHEDSESGLKST